MSVITPHQQSLEDRATWPVICRKPKHHAPPVVRSAQRDYLALSESDRRLIDLVRDGEEPVLSGPAAAFLRRHHGVDVSA